MDEPERRLLRSFQFVMKGPRRLQHGAGARDIGRNKGGRAINRPVDMGFGRKMENCLGCGLFHDAGHSRRVHDVGLDQVESTLGFEAFDGRAVACIGQLVHDDDFLIRFPSQVMAQRRADKARTPGDQPGHRSPSPAEANSAISARRGSFWSLSDRMRTDGGKGQSMPIAGSSCAMPQSWSGA